MTSKQTHVNKHQSQRPSQVGCSRDQISVQLLRDLVHSIGQAEQRERAAARERQQLLLHLMHLLKRQLGRAL